MKKTIQHTDRTKNMLAAALKKLMKQKPLDKITIQELTEICGIRRQNFYYHFEDIYDLMHWMFECEALSLLEQHEGVLLWKDGMLNLFRYLNENREVCLCAAKSMGRRHFKRFFQLEIYEIIHNNIEQIGNSIGDSSESNDFEFLTHFYVSALTGIAESWLMGELDYTPEELVSLSDLIFHDHIRGAKERLKDKD